MIEDVDLRTPPARRLSAALALCLALFLGSVSAGMLSASFSGPPVIEWVLRVGIVLLLGGIALGCVWFALRALRGDDDRARGVPPEALARCLTCGTLSPNDAACPACEEPPAYRAGAFHVERKGLLGAALGLVFSVTILGFGVLVIAGPYYDGERRLWALLAFAGLGLLIALVGAAGVLGSLLHIREGLGGVSSLSFQVQGPERQAFGTGASVWGQLAWLEGRASVTGPLVPRAPGGYRAALGDLAFAEVMATLDAAGIVRIEETTTYTWRLGDKPAEGATPVRRAPLPFEGTTTRATTVSLAMSLWLQPDDDGELVLVDEKARRAPEDAITAARFFSRWLRPSASLDDLRRNLAEDPAHRAQAEAHARALRDRGVPVAAELVEAVLSRLAPEGGPPATAAAPGSGAP